MHKSSNFKFHKTNLLAQNKEVHWTSHQNLSCNQTSCNKLIWFPVDIRDSLDVKDQSRLKLRRTRNAVVLANCKAIRLFTKILTRTAYFEYLSDIDGSLKRREFKPLWSHVRTICSSTAPPVANIKFDDCISFSPISACKPFQNYYSSVFTSTSLS